MQHSSSFCRTQEASQRDRAASSSLENVRTIAEKAATAWAHEALLAEQRERRGERLRSAASSLVEEKRLLGDKLARDNMDRDFAMI